MSAPPLPLSGGTNAPTPMTLVLAEASVPEPPPVNRGVPVTPLLLAWLEQRADTAELRALVLQRDAFGRAKYGQPLMSDDGRDSLEDARQELGDLAQYIFKARMHGVDVSEVRRMLDVVAQLCDVEMNT